MKMSKYLKELTFRNKNVLDMDKKELLEAIEWLHKDYRRVQIELQDRNRDTIAEMKLAVERLKCDNLT